MAIFTTVEAVPWLWLCCRLRWGVAGAWLWLGLSWLGLWIGWGLSGQKGGHLPLQLLDLLFQVFQLFICGICMATGTGALGLQTHFLLRRTDMFFHQGFFGNLSVLFCPE